MSRAIHVITKENYFLPTFSFLFSTHVRSTNSTPRLSLRNGYRNWKKKIGFLWRKSQKWETWQPLKGPKWRMEELKRQKGLKKTSWRKRSRISIRPDSSPQPGKTPTWMGLWLRRHGHGRQLNIPHPINTDNSGGKLVLLSTPPPAATRTSTCRPYPRLWLKNINWIMGLEMGWET